MVSFDIVCFRFPRCLGVSPGAETSCNDFVGLDGKDFELAVPHSARFFLKQLFTGHLVFLKRHIHQVPASECRTVAFALLFQLFYLFNDVQRLSPCTEHLPVWISLYLFVRYLRQSGKKSFA